jgi:hypothetical protein
MNDPTVRGWFESHVPESLMAAFFAAVGWWVQRKIARADALEDRIQALERDKVTKADVEELRESMVASITNSFARVESRTDEILLHLAQQDRR